MAFKCFCFINLLFLVAVAVIAQAPCYSARPNRVLFQEAGPPVTFEKVSVGVFVTCGIATGTGDLYCAGNNDDGAVGDGTQIRRTTMTKVIGDGPWIDVSAGDWHACGTKADNTAYCWGFNEGRLGTGKADPIQATTPQQVNGTWSQISAGHFHSCGLQTSGQVLCWGNNKNGRLGNGEISGIGSLGAETYEFSPLPVKNGANFKTISAKGSHTCGLKNDGTAWCWGGNDDGELGIGEFGGYKTVPTKVPGSWKEINNGLRFTCGIDSKDDAYCWGALRGGNSTHEQLDSKPQKIGPPGQKWSKITGGMQHACGILTDGTARCFGLGWHGQLMNGLNTSYAEPFAISCNSTEPCEPKGGGLWKDIYAGEYNSCGIYQDGTLVCAGENPYGSLGSGTDNNFIYDPTPVTPVFSIAAVAPAMAPVMAPAMAPVPALAPSLAPVPLEEASAEPSVMLPPPVAPVSGAEKAVASVVAVFAAFVAAF
ncbi:hypothetical protein Ndes2437A_g04673 [Nannochloris sp. 'desiccata']